MDDRHELTEENAAAARQAKAVAGPANRKNDRRLERLQDLLAEALEEPDALRANLRAATADLLAIGYRLAAGIKAGMELARRDPKAHKDVMPAIGSMALVHRQATRYVQLDRDWASEEGEGRRAGPRQAESTDEGEDSGI